MTVASDRRTFLTSDLQGVQFVEGADGTATAWVQAFKAGEYAHPFYGKIELNEERFRRFHSNFVSRIREVDLDIDYEHKMDPSKGAKAAGWVQDVRFDASKLEYQVKFTKEAVEEIKEDKWRYFSADFTEEWEHPQTRIKHEDVLFGGALTNRPFLKGMSPINLSELSFSIRQLKELGVEIDEKLLASGGNAMDEKLKAALIKKFGLADDATDEQILSAAEAENEPEPDPEPEGDPNDPNSPNNPNEPRPGAEKGLSEEIKRLAESNPALAKLVYLVEAQGQELAETKQRLTVTEAANRLSDVNTKLSELSDKATGERALPPVVTDMLRPILLSEDVRNRDAIYKAFAKLTEVGFVELGEDGRTNPERVGGASNEVFSELDRRVEKLLSDNDQLSYTEAVERVMKQDPKLAERWMNAAAPTPASVE